MKRLAILLLLALAACDSPEPPSACGPAPPPTTVNATETATVAFCFDDPNGDVLEYSAKSSNPKVATASVSGTDVTIAAVGPGSATVTVTARDPGGLTAEQRFEVEVPNRAPEPRGAMPPVTVPVGAADTLDASSYFTEPDGEALTYSAASSNPAAATVAVSGSAVTVAALAKGTTDVTVTATDPGGLAATQTFEVTVPNRAPVAGDSIPDIEVFVGDAAEVDASEHFSDPDGDALAFAASSRDAGVASVSVSGAVVTVEAEAQGSATVTVTATDSEGLSAETSFEVTVPNRAPVAGDPIPHIEVFVGDSVEVDASEHFSDPDGDALAFAASSPDAGVASVSVSGAVVTVEGVAQGSATVTVTATDSEGLSAETTFEVTVPNRAPVAGDPIPDIEVFVGDSVEVDASEHFSDPDGDALAFAASSPDAGVASVSVSGAVVTVEAAAQGSATVTVTATDPEGLSAETTFEVTVPNRAPVAGDPILDIEVFVGDAAGVDASDHFDDPDGDDLAFAASSSDAGVASVSVSGAAVRVEAAAQGSATVTVTATDPGGLAATQTFEVTVPNRAPVAGDPILDIEVFVGGAAGVDASEHFDDPDGDDLAFAASSSDAGVASVSVSGAEVRVEAAAQGLATVTVTATDPEGLSAETTFEVTVPNRAPVAGDPILDIEVFVGDAAGVDASEHFDDPDGDELAFAASSSDAGVASVSVSGAAVRVEAAAQGSATVTVTATDPEGLSAETSFEVTVPNRAPVAGDPILDIEVFVGDAAGVDASEHFDDPDGDELAFAASSSDAGVASVSVSGAEVRVEAAAQGSATVTVTATDPEGLSAETSFEVTVPNRAPVAGDPILDIEVFVGDAARVDASDHFDDPDGDELAFAVSTSDAGVASVSVSGAALRVEAAAQGSATVTVTATDPEGLSAETTFEVTVPNRAPVAGDPILDIEVFVGGAAGVDASEHFDDPDGDELAFAASSSDVGVASVSVSGATVRVEAAAQGSATVTVTATDPEGLSVETTFQVTVPNRAPVAGDPIPDIEVFVGDAAGVDASEHFDDPDGDELAFAASSSDVGVASVSVSGATVRVEAAAQGSATVTVTATDPEGLSAETTFQVTVPNRAPVAGDPIPDIEVVVGDSAEVDALEHFDDPDGDELAFAASSSDADVASVLVSGATVRVEAAAQGSATVTVTATDPEGLSAETTFQVTVPNRAPVAGDPIPDIEVVVGDSAEVDALEHFDDPDGDELAFAASSSDAGVASVSVSGATVTVEAAARGSATVTVTATDPEGLSAETTFRVTVANRAPVAGDPIPDMDVFVGDAAGVDASDHFNDPDGDELAFAASSSDADVASVSVSGAAVRVEAAAQGSATVTVTATDPGGLAATQTFEVTVPNRAPVAGDPIPDMEVFVGDSAEVDASDHFNDPDGDELAFAASSSDADVASVSVSGAAVRVEAAAQGSATVTVTATDPGGLAATQTFEVTVPNRAPVAGDPIPDIEVFVEAEAEVDASDHFDDLDGDELTFSASSSESGVASVSVSGAAVRVEGVAQGSATVTVTATDPEGLSAETTFEVTVPNRSPVAGDPIPDMEVFVGDSAEVDASTHFDDPDGDELAFAASSSDAAVVSVSVSGAAVTVDAAAQGSATVTVTATDPEGLSAETTFEVTVPNRAPVAGDPIPDMEVFVGDSAEVDASTHFDDPDGDELAFAASSSDAGVASVSVSGAAVTVEGVAQGSATVTVTATDPEGLSARLIFEVTVAHNDRGVLEALYHATDGPNWTNSDEWLTDAPLGEWHGVYTDASGRVDSLDLTYNQLTGAIPSELGDLSNLTDLRLGGNQLTGAIPSELGDLSNLEGLHLVDNQLTGAIPSWLGDLSNLTDLRLGDNQLTGAIPSELGDLSNLTDLRLGGNQLTGAIPSWLGDLSNLEWLHLSGNQLTGAIPSELGDLSNLEGLHLVDNQLTGAIPSELGDLSNLTDLRLGDNQLTGAIPSELGDLSNLTDLRLGGNQLTDPIPSELGDLSNLTDLRLGGNQLTGAIPSELGDLSNLKGLNLSGNQLTGAIPSELGDLSNLTDLRLGGNQLTDPIPDSFLTLDDLSIFYFNDNGGLCAPSTDEFTEWLDGIEDWRGVWCVQTKRT